MKHHFSRSLLSIFTPFYAGVLNPHEGSLNTEPLKAALRQAGVLQAAAQVWRRRVGCMHSALSGGSAGRVGCKGAAAAAAVCAHGSPYMPTCICFLCNRWRQTMRPP